MPRADGRCQRHHLARPAHPAAAMKELQAWPLAAEARYRLGYAPGTYMSSLHLAWRMRHERGRSGRCGRWLAAPGSFGRLADECLGQAFAALHGHFARAGHGTLRFSPAVIIGATGWNGWACRVRPCPPPPTIHDFGTLRLSDPRGRTADVPVTGHDRRPARRHCSAMAAELRERPNAPRVRPPLSRFLQVNEAPLQEDINVFYAWDIGHGQTYCLEAPTTVVGAAIRWMQELRLFDHYAEMDALAAAIARQRWGGVCPRFNRPGHTL